MLDARLRIEAAKSDFERVRDWPGKTVKFEPGTKFWEQSSPLAEQNPRLTAFIAAVTSLDPFLNKSAAQSESV